MVKTFCLAFGLLMMLAMQVPASAQNRAYCDLKGAVFVIEDRNLADFRIFVEKTEALADLPVYQAPNLLFADRSGLWFFTKTRAQAAFTVCYVKDRAMADFSVFYLDNESFAGCR